MINIRNFYVALCSLKNSLGYVGTIVLTLGITLGSLVAIYNLNYQILGAPLPYPDEDRLYVMQTDIYMSGYNVSQHSLNMTPYAAVVDAYERETDFFEEKAMVGFYLDTVRSLPDTPQVNSAYVSPEYLSMLQPPMKMGRIFEPEETLESFAPVVVLAYSTWVDVFNSDPDILDQTVRFGEVDFKVIGVLAESFVEPQIIEAGRVTEVWLPWDFNRVPPVYRGWESFIEHEFLVGKVKKGSSIADIENHLTSMVNTRFKEETAQFSGFSETVLQMRIVSYRDLILGDSSLRAIMLLSGSLVLLLIAAANITNLILARAANRQRIMAIQAALGARKLHLFNGVFAEIMLLMLGSAILSLIVAYFGIYLMKEIAVELMPRVAELSLTWQSVAVAFLCSVILALFFSTLVSRQVNYRALNGVLQSSGKGVGVQISKRVRQVLIVSQIALTGILLVASLQILSGAIARLYQPLGLNTENVYQVILNMGGQTNAPDAERRSNLVAIRDLLESNGKVESVTLASCSPLGETSPSVENVLSADADFMQSKVANVTYADNRYFDVLGLELVAGHNITDHDFESGANVLIVNERYARTLQPDGDVLNKRFHFGLAPADDNVFEVIGIAKDLTLPGQDEIDRMFVAGVSNDFPRLILEMKPGQRFGKVELNEIMAKVNGEFKASLLLNMPDAHQVLVSKDRVSAWLTAALAILALSLAAIGTYGVLSYSVQLRRYELGIRMAMGARPKTIFAQMLKDNLVPVLIGFAFSLLVLSSVWIWLQESTLSIEVSPLAGALSFGLIFGLAALASLLSVWSVIRNPAINALRAS